jgi:hypothetical protein
MTVSLIHSKYISLTRGIADIHSIRNLKKIHHFDSNPTHNPIYAKGNEIKGWSHGHFVLEVILFISPAGGSISLSPKSRFSEYCTLQSQLYGNGDIKVAAKSIRVRPSDIRSDEGKERLWGYSDVNEQDVIRLWEKNKVDSYNLGHFIWYHNRWHFYWCDSKFSLRTLCVRKLEE